MNYHERQERERRALYERLRREEGHDFSSMEPRYLHRGFTQRGPALYVNGRPQTILQTYTDGSSGGPVVRYDTDQGTVRRTRRGWVFQAPGDWDTRLEQLPLVHITRTRPREKK